MTVRVKKLDENAILPTYGTEFAAGADLYAMSAETIAPGETKLIHTGIAMEIPVGYGGFLYARSGLATKRGLAPANKVGVIDADYRGEIMVAMYNQRALIYLRKCDIMKLMILWILFFCLQEQKWRSPFVVLCFCKMRRKGAYREIRTFTKKMYERDSLFYLQIRYFMV